MILNAQPNIDDEDISITHQRTGITIKIECKNASRGSFKSGKGYRKSKVPHCMIKCHKSRSDFKESIGIKIQIFDIVISNLSNAVIAGECAGFRVNGII